LATLPEVEDMKKTDDSSLPEVKEPQKCKHRDNRWHNGVATTIFQTLVKSHLPQPTQSAGQEEAVYHLKQL